FGPHHCARCLGSVHTANTSSRGASNSRTAMIARGSCSRSRLFPAATSFLLRLQFAQVLVEAVEPFLPKRAIVFQPFVQRLERSGLNAAGAPLRLAAARDEPGTLQHLEMFGDRGSADGEGLGELTHGRFSERKPRQDGASGRVGEGREGGAETVHG